MKAKIALEVVKGQRTVQEIGSHSLRGTPESGGAMEATGGRECAEDFPGWPGPGRSG